MEATESCTEVLMYWCVDVVVYWYHVLLIPPRNDVLITLLTTFCCWVCFCRRLATSLQRASFSLKHTGSGFLMSWTRCSLRPASTSISGSSSGLGSRLLTVSWLWSWSRWSPVCPSSAGRRSGSCSLPLQTSLLPPDAQTTPGPRDTLLLWRPGQLDRCTSVLQF